MVEQENDRYFESPSGLVRILQDQEYFVYTGGKKPAVLKGHQLHSGHMPQIDRTKAPGTFKEMQPYLFQISRYAHAHEMLFLIPRDKSISDLVNPNSETLGVPKLRAYLTTEANNHCRNNTQAWQEFIAWQEENKDDETRYTRHIDPSEISAFKSIDEKGLESRVFATESEYDFSTSHYDIMTRFVYWILEREKEKGEIPFHLVAPETVRQWLGRAESGKNEYKMTVAPRDWNTFLALERSMPMFREFADSYRKSQSNDEDLVVQLENSCYLNYKLRNTVHANIISSALSSRTKESQSTCTGDETESSGLQGIFHDISKRLAIRIDDKFSYVILGKKVGRSPGFSGPDFIVSGSKGKAWDTGQEGMHILYWSSDLIFKNVLLNVLYDFCLRTNVMKRGDVKDYYLTMDSTDAIIDYFSQPGRGREVMVDMHMELFGRKRKGFKARAAVEGYVDGFLWPYLIALETGKFDRDLGYKLGTCINLMKAIETVTKAAPSQLSEIRQPHHNMSKKRINQRIAKIKAQLHNEYGYDILEDLPDRTFVNQYTRLELIDNTRIVSRLEINGNAVDTVIGFDSYDEDVILSYPTEKVLSALDGFGISILAQYVGIPIEVIEKRNATHSTSQKYTLPFMSER